MKKTIILLLLSITTFAFAEDHPDDGIYLRSHSKSALWVNTQDEKKVFLGASQDLRIEKSIFISLDNANKRLLLSLTIPYDARIDLSTYILVVDGVAFRQSGFGSSPEKTSQISFCISGEDKAKKVSKLLGVPVSLRRHPGHKLLISFTPTRGEFDVGTEVTVTFQVTNVGTDTVSFMRSERKGTGRDNQYLFSAYYRGRQVKDVGTFNRSTLKAIECVLKPGEAFEDKIDLSKWFSFVEPGIYELHGACSLAFFEIKDKLSDMIWVDYVSGDFMVKIKETKETLNKELKAMR